MQRHQARFITAIIISLIAHIIFIISTPEFIDYYNIPEQEEKVFEVKRIELEKEAPKPEPEPEPKPEPEPEKVMTKQMDDDYLQIPSTVEKVIDGKIKEIKQGEQFTPPPPLVSLPRSVKTVADTKSPITFKKYVPPESIKQFEPEGSAMIGNIFGKKRDIPLPKIKAETKFHIKQAIVQERIKKGTEDIIGEEPDIKLWEKTPNLELKGEIIDRQLDFKPELPSATIDIPTTVVLDFEVRPDGTVEKIRPQQRVNVYLEGIATDYLKRWKFAQLPHEAAQKNQKGTFIIKFELE